jgi:alkylhydroperoxidase family enzyme
MTWLPQQAEGATPFERVLGLRPDLLEAFRSFHAQFWEHGLVDPVLLELCRLRVAHVLDCPAELGIRHRGTREAGLDEGKLAQLESWKSSDAFNRVERAVLAYTDGFVLDPHGISNEVVAAVTDALGEAGAVALTEALAIFDGFARFRIALEIDGPDEAPQIVAPPSLNPDPEAGGHVY